MVVNNMEEPNNKLLKQLYILLNTVKGEVPLLRGFGLDSRIVDMPVNMIQLGIFTELEKQINKYIKGLKLLNVNCQSRGGVLYIQCEVGINE